MELMTANKEAYKQFLASAKQAIISTRIKTAKVAANQQMQLYWWLGQHIATAQQKFGWGKSIVSSLSDDLNKMLQGSTFGFSPRNLWDMRRFYLAYKDYPDLRQLVAEIPWGQNLLILQRVKSSTAREYYLTATRDNGWTRAALDHQIKAKSYEHQANQTKQHNFEQVLPAALAEQANETLKNVYLLDMLGLSEPVLETQVEQKMVEKIKSVMLELGFGFAFIGNQYRVVSPSGTESYIDLLFSNRRLRCLVAIELKVGKFKPEYAGKMNYYLNLLDDLVKEEWENPSIGIILCTSKNHVDVEYTLRGVNKPVGVSEYCLTSELPKELSDKLPDPEQLKSEILDDFNAFCEDTIESDK